MTHILDEYPLEDLRAFFDEAPVEEQKIVLRALAQWHPLPHQVPPEGTDWYLWLLLGGRGTGKTDGGANYVTRHVHGPPCDPRLPGGHRIGIIGPTLGDAVEACVNGPSGLKVHDPHARLVTAPGGLLVRWPSGAEAKLFGAHTPDDVERLRAGGNRCLVWCEELAAWRQLAETWNQMRFGLRLGDWPRAIATTTPKARPLLRELIKHPRTRVSHGTTNDNPHLDSVVRQALEDAYGGTRLGRQELLGELLEDLEGALWDRPNLDQNRVASAPILRQITIGVDPSTWGPDSGNEYETIGQGLETGIVVVGSTGGARPELYILEDLSCRVSTEQWAKKVTQAWRKWSETAPTLIVPEMNLGGWITSAIRMADEDARFFYEKGKPGVRAAQGKRARAEPVASVYEQGRAHHVGNLPILEDQMVGWDPTEPWSPDRVDALVWAVYALCPWMAQGGTVGAAEISAARLPTLSRKYEPMLR